MGVETSEALSGTWTRWQGHVINGMFPLGRFLGCSDHSGVFLTEHAARRASPVAIKLVSTSRHLAISQLPRWRRASGLIHPHLLHLWELGGCQLDGSPYLYAVMDYADQTLAQLLQHRALTEAEANEMLPPVLDALLFLHGKGLVQGQLKPTNILVVGDQIKLATDTVRRVSERAIGTGASTLYDAPEDRIGHNSTAGDIWALGVSLFEAISRRRPPDSLASKSDAVVLPLDFPSALGEVVTRCLRYNPQERPSVAELMEGARAPSPGVAQALTPQLPAALAPPEPAPSQQGPSQIASSATWPAPSREKAPPLPAMSIVVISAIGLLVLGWIAAREFRATRVSSSPSPAIQGVEGTVSAPAPAETPRDTPRAAPPAPRAAIEPPKQAAVATPAEFGRPLVPVIPNVPVSASQTIHGHIKVWVRVIVAQDGSVSAALVDRSGPSRYFERLALEAARKWMFPPADSADHRLMQIQFDFSRDKTMGHAVTLQ